MHHKAISLPESTPDQKEPDLEKTLHLVWMGSKLREKHITRILKWKKLNPGYKVNIWIESKFELEIREQLKQKVINVKLVSSLKISNRIEQTLEKFVEVREDKLIANYAAASDLYRFIILRQHGGWYADTDIVPIDLTKINIKQPLNFHINSNRSARRINHLSPSVIYSSSNSILMEVSTKIVDAFCAGVTKEQLLLIRSAKASHRMLATHMSSGYILRASLGNITVNGISIIEVLNELDNTIKNPEIFDSISSTFKSNFEQLWIVDELQNNLLVPHKGITLDDDYLKIIYGKNSDFDWVYEELAIIFDAKKEFFNKVSAVNIITKIQSSDYNAHYLFKKTIQTQGLDKELTKSHTPVSPRSGS